MVAQLIIECKLVLVLREGGKGGKKEMGSAEEKQKIVLAGLRNES